MMCNLTDRQSQVVELVRRGYTNKAIAREIGLAVRTVEFHIERAAERIPGDGKPRYKFWFLYDTAAG